MAFALLVILQTFFKIFSEFSGCINCLLFYCWDLCWCIILAFMSAFIHIFSALYCNLVYACANDFLMRGCFSFIMFVVLVMFVFIGNSGGTLKSVRKTMSNIGTSTYRLTGAEIKCEIDEYTVDKASESEKPGMWNIPDSIPDCDVTHYCITADSGYESFAGVVDPLTLEGYGIEKLKPKLSPGEMFVYRELFENRIQAAKLQQDSSVRNLMGYNAHPLAAFLADWKKIVDPFRREKLFKLFFDQIPLLLIADRFSHNPARKEGSEVMIKRCAKIREELIRLSESEFGVEWPFVEKWDALSSRWLGGLDFLSQNSQVPIDLPLARVDLPLARVVYEITNFVDLNLHQNAKCNQDSEIQTVMGEWTKGIGQSNGANPAITGDSIVDAWNSVDSICGPDAPCDRIGFETLINRVMNPVVLKVTSMEKKASDAHAEFVQLAQTCATAVAGAKQTAVQFIVLECLAVYESVNQLYNQEDAHVSQKNAKLLAHVHTIIGRAMTFGRESVKWFSRYNMGVDERFLVEFAKDLQSIRKSSEFAIEKFMPLIIMQLKIVFVVSMGSYDDRAFTTRVAPLLNMRKKMKQIATSKVKWENVPVFNELVIWLVKSMQTMVTDLKLDEGESKLIDHCLNGYIDQFVYINSSNNSEECLGGGADQPLQDADFGSDVKPKTVELTRGLFCENAAAVCSIKTKLPELKSSSVLGQFAKMFSKTSKSIDTEDNQN